MKTTSCKSCKNDGVVAVPAETTPSEESIPMVMVEVVDSERQIKKSRGSFHAPSQAGLCGEGSSQHWTPQHSRTSSQHSTRSHVSQTSKHSSLSTDSPRRQSQGNKRVIHFDEVINYNQ